jgi:hypothetical protein
MNTPNPFAPPVANLDGPMSASGHTTGDVPESVVVILAQTRPWLRLMLGVLVTGLALLVVFFIGFGMLGWFMPGNRPLGFGLALLLPMLFVMAIYTPPAVYLARAASSIRRLQEGGSWPALEEALRSQRSLWRYLGILFLVIIAFYAVAFLIRIVTH